jgi:hypothetical protein
MTTENRIRELLKSKLSVQVTRRVRGPFTLTRPNGAQTEHRTRKEALNALLVSARVMNRLVWRITPKEKGRIKWK